MARYVMTPARRAALRKAQLISAQRRRRSGTIRTAAHSTRQRVELAYREGQLQHHRTHEHREVLGQKTKALPKKAAKKAIRSGGKRVAKTAVKAGLTLGAATAIGYTAAGMTSNTRQVHAANRHLKSMNYGRTTRVSSSRVHGTRIKALPRGR